MGLYFDKDGVGLIARLRIRGFWAYFIPISVLVFILLSAMDIGLPYFFGQNQPKLSVNLVWDIGANIAISLITAGIAWKFNGKPLINRPDTIKLDLDA